MRDQDDRVDKRIEAAMNRMTEAIKEIKMELKEFKAELKAGLEKSTDEKLETFYWKLVVTLSGIIVVLVPSNVLAFELLGGRIMFPGNR